jgi:hypothetical protein
MKQRRPLLVAFCLTYLGALIILLPARLAESGVAQLTAGHLRLTQTSGRLWQGAGELDQRMADGRFLALGHIAWQVDGWSLAKGQISVALQQAIDQQSGTLQLTLTAERLQLQNVHIHLPARPLATLSPMLAALAPDGRLEVKSDQFSVRHRESPVRYQGRLAVTWHPALFLDGVRAGSYDLELIGDDKTALTGDLRTRQGALQLDGKLEVNARQALLIDGRVRLMPGLESRRLQPVLRALCGNGQEGCLLGNRTR